MHNTSNSHSKDHSYNSIPNKDSLPSIQSIYSQSPVQQSTDHLTNQTCFLLNFHNAYHQAQNIPTQNIKHIKCIYCKAFYFPQPNPKTQPEKFNPKKGNNKHQPKTQSIPINQPQKQYVCGLCGAFNDIKNQFSFNNLPPFQPININSLHHQNSSKFNSHFQSLIISQNQTKTSEANCNQSIGLSKKVSSNDNKQFSSYDNKKESSYDNKKGSSYDQKQNSITFVFLIDLSTLNSAVKQSIIVYLKTVITEYFLRLSRQADLRVSRQAESNPQEQSTFEEGEKLKQDRQIIPLWTYRLVLAMNIEDKLYLGDINSLSTVNIDSIVNEKILSNIQVEITPEMIHRLAERKESLMRLISQCSIKLSGFEEIFQIQDYLNIIIEVQEEQSNNNQSENSKKFRHGINGTKHFNMIVDILSADKDITRSYVVNYIAGSPLLNFEPHHVNRPNIYSILYLFHQPFHSTPQSHSSSLNDFKLFHSTTLQFKNTNIKNQILLIRDNDQTHFLNSNQHGLQEFYYLLYDLFSIVEMPKFFRPKWTIKTQNKYPPILTNDFPKFFIKPTHVLMFVVSSLINTSSNHSKFQISVHFQDSQRKQKLWIINFTKDTLKQTQQLNQLYKMTNRPLNIPQQASPFPLMQILPQIYNYIYILVKFAMSVCIRGINELTNNRQSASGKSLFSSNTVNCNQICILFESIVNFGKFKMGNIEITCEFVSDLYDYCVGVKNINYQILKFMSACEIDPKKAAQMLYPLLVRSQHQENSSCIVYWGDGYYCLNDHSEDQNSQDEDWYGHFIDSYHEFSGKYYTHRCYYETQQLSDQNELIKFYLKKLQLKPHHPKITYLPLYYSP